MTYWLKNGFDNLDAIGNYSGLLVPDFWQNHGQYLDYNMLLVGIQFLNIGENNPGLPIESTPVKPVAIKGMGRVKINEIVYDYYPLHGLQYELNLENENEALYSDLEHMARSIFFCIEYLQRHNIAHNLMMVPGFPFKIFLVPRRNQVAFEGFDGFKTLPGFPEISSHLMLVDENEWNKMTVNDVWNAWQAVNRQTVNKQIT